MPRGRMMRARRMTDGRNPYGARGGYVMSGRRGRRDRGMDYNYDMRDYGYRDREDDMTYEYGDMRRGGRRGGDGHYPMGRGETYYPVEAMGYFSGYYGNPEEDYARGRGRDRAYDMNYGMRDYGEYRDYRDYAGDYGEKLTKEELEHWHHKLMQEVDDEQGKNFFKKENIEQKARQMGIPMSEIKSEELAVASLMMYTDYCKVLKPYIGQNMDIYVKLGEAFLMDKDSAVKGGEKLALYYDIVSDEEY